MNASDKLSLKSFAEELESRLAALTADDLRSVIRAMAWKVSPAERREFLDRLRPTSNPAKAAASVARLDTLLGDIASLEEELRAELGDPDRLERVRSFYNDDENPYADFEPELESLFERCRAAFESGEMKLARDAYAALFGILVLEDDYGFRVSHPESVEMAEECARYLRAVVETAPPTHRATDLLKAVRDLRSKLWEANQLHLQHIFDVKPEPVSESGVLLDDLVQLLREGNEYIDDLWLREAVRIKRGADGLAELARQEGRFRPHAWTDWLELIAAENNPAKLLDAAKEALSGLPKALRLRAVAADHLARAAEAMADRETVLTARWEAFRAEPSLSRLLDLRDAAPDINTKSEWMKRAVDYLLQNTPETTRNPEITGRGIDEAKLLLEPGDRQNTKVSRCLIAYAQLLAGDWQTALEKAKKEPSLGWSSRTNTQAVVVPVLMAWVAGWPEQALQSNFAELFGEALEHGEAWSQSESRTRIRLREALAEVVPTWSAKEESEKASVLEVCVNLAMARVNAIVNNQHRGAYGRAAMLAWATAELLESRGNRRGAEQLISDLLARHSRKPSFKKELAARRALPPQYHTRR